MNTKKGSIIGLAVLLFMFANFARGAGVTIITHGYQSDALSWVAQMANAIAIRAGGNETVSQYTLVLTNLGSRCPFGSPNIQIHSFTRDSSSPPADTLANREVIVKVCWSGFDAGICNEPFGLGTVPTEEIGFVVATALRLPNFATDGSLANPLCELPMHLIGHSRGGSVMATVARILGENGIWIDHLTTLDPHPLDCPGSNCDDAPAVVYTNVVFADNYWQTNSAGDDPNGRSIPGTYEGKLVGIVNHSFFTLAHSQIHTYYHGTIDTIAAIVDEVTVQNSWYDTSLQPPRPARNATGFYFSRLNGGTLNGGTRVNAASGLRIAGAHREPLNVSATDPNLWDNIEIVDFVNALTVTQGDTFEVHVYYEDLNRDATIEFGLDADANPYNGTYQTLATVETSSRSPTEKYLPKVLDSASVAPNTYYPYAKISNGIHSRYYYAQGRLTVNPAPPPPGAPTVTITPPSDGSTVSSSDATLVGTASAGTTQVTWVNEAKSESGSASGTTSWSATVPVVRGNNRVTVTARDANDRSGSASIALIYNPLSESLDIYASEGCFVASGEPNRPQFGGALVVGVDPGNTGNERILLKFGLSAIPQCSTINNSLLECLLYRANPLDASSINVTSYRVTEDWSESSTTWDLQPSYDPSFGPSRIVSSSPGYYSWDVSPVVNGWYSGNNQNFGFILVSSVENTGTTNDREFRDKSFQKLTVNYTTERVPPTITIISPTTNPTFNTTSASVNLAGTASDNCIVSGVTWANTATGQTGTANGTTSWNATVPLADGTNQITVAAHDPAGNSGTDAIIVIYTPPDTTPPTVPTNLTASAVSSSQTYVTWGASTDTGGSGVNGYKVYRDGLLVTNSQALSVADSGLTANTTYCYTVAACDNAGNVSAQSSQACAITQPTSSNMPPCDINAGLVAYYPLDGDALDQSGNGQNGTPDGDPQIVAGVIGSAFYFDGVDDRIHLPATFLGGGLPEGTVACWVRVDSFDQTYGRIIINRGIAAMHTRLLLGIAGGGRLAAYLNDTQAPLSIDHLQLGCFAHVAMTWNGSRLKYFIDATNTGDFAFTASVPSGGSETVDIGVDDQDVGFFHGIIDEVRIYGHALSDSEILCLATGKPSLCSPRMTLAGDFVFTLTGESNRNYRIEATTSLPATSWTALTTVSNIAGPVQITNFNASSFSRRFYRAVLVP